MPYQPFVMPGRGLSTVFTRSYNSLSSYSGPLGSGWDIEGKRSELIEEEDP